MTIHLMKIAYAPLKPILIALLAVDFTFLQFETDPKILNTLGAGALVIIILYVVTNLMKVIKGFNSAPQVVIPSHADPELIMILNRLVDITNSNRANIEILRTDSAVIKERLVPAEDLRAIVNEELANSRAKLGIIK